MDFESLLGLLFMLGLIFLAMKFNKKKRKKRSRDNRDRDYDNDNDSDYSGGDDGGGDD